MILPGRSISRMIPSALVAADLVGFTGAFRFRIESDKNGGGTAMFEDFKAITSWRIGVPAIAAALATFSSISCREPGLDGGPADARRSQSPGRATSVPAAGLTGPPRTNERSAERLRMVTRQIAGRGVRDERVLEAIRAVPRHWFVPQEKQSVAYNDRPLQIGYRQTISQPYIVAFMTELLEIEPGDKVLEIGTGSGYQATILAELTDQVYTIEIVEPLAKRTIASFEAHGYTKIHARIGDGYRGWPEQAPFQAIIVTCAPDDVPKPLIDQLAPGGRMCIPVGDRPGMQSLVLLRKNADGSIDRRHVLPVAFVPMTGEAQDARRR